MSNKVLITNEQNAVKIPSGLRILIRRSCNAVLNYEKFEGSAEISVIFVDNQRIRELNNQYRNKDSATWMRTTAARCWATLSSRWNGLWNRRSSMATACSGRSLT